MSLKRFLSVAWLSLLVGGSSASHNLIHSRLKQTESSSLSSQIETYHSFVLGRDRTYGIVLPPGYEQQPQARYPVVFLLHGGHGDSTTWFVKGKALEVIETLYRRRKLPPSIIITPDGNDNRNSSGLWDPEYVNGQYGNIVSVIGDELVQQVKAHYHTRSDPRFWAIGGLSSGGWGAINVGLHHPEHFKTLFSHSGYFVHPSGRENSPIEFIKTLSPGMRHSFAIYLDAGEGEGDRRYLAQSQAFHQVLNQLEVENEFNHFPGGHSAKRQRVRGFWQRTYRQIITLFTDGDAKESNVGWLYWHKHLADSLSYVGERFRAAESHRIISKQEADRERSR